MKRFAATSFALMLAAGTAIVAQQKPSPELAALAGTYQAVAVSRAGQEEPPAVVESLTAKIDGDQLTIRVKDKVHPAKIGVNPKAKPAAIDISPTEGPDKGHTFPGIYELENGELTLAFTERGERPTEFKAEGGVLVVRFKRQNAGKP